MKTLISQGDIHRRHNPQASERHVNLYQGNGTFGSCYGPWGLHDTPHGTRPYESHVKTHFMHLGHFVRAQFKADYLLPIAKCHWEQEPADILAYDQRQSFYDGLLTTQFQTGQSSIRTVSWFDPVCRDVAGFQIDLKGNGSPILVIPFQELDVHYGQTMHPKFEAAMEQGCWQARIRCLNANTTLRVRTNARLESVAGGVKIHLSQGRNFIIIAINAATDIAAEQSLLQTINWWHATWNRIGWLDLPENSIQQVWVRSVAYILSSYNEADKGMAPPMGLSGSAWPFSFPQDLSYIHPVLLAIGKLDIAKAWIEYYSKRIKGMQDYTRRLLNMEGVFVPWVFPYGALDGFHDPEPPNQCYYQLHNSAYVCRMAYETAIMLNDKEWSQTYAWPLIAETACFYMNICKKENDALWHIHVIPSMGQDEMGGINQKDYLCALFGAQYCFQTAVALGLDTQGRMRAILKDGLALAPLLSERGYFFTCQGSGSKDFGQQKHPPQLNPLAYLPLADTPDAPTRRAYDLRYEITRDSKAPFFYGWTLGEFLLASARLRDVSGWRKDWANIQRSDYMDPDWIQIYETSKSYHMPFYITSHGLFAQAILDGVLSTWWNRMDTGCCLPWDGAIRFGNMATAFGVTMEGEITPDCDTVIFHAGRDTSFAWTTETITLKQGESRRYQKKVIDHPKGDR
ncbi:MAG: hypothetical protein KKG09_10000 [Verrucomicrobia bacterium]|nr:hypothetical protein [Verrucomicrobiota bacterium]MBU4247809.1 hypothetical protein [Verrucomicrobiota bacterium]MBU4292098.1 hypothetical protein [Verrucomicrobiota bacterium]MBU4498323.1 hypothetical protein [Verrucomicrobiota bacterium]MCG2678918.1 hypothetical protein [Kiritimatiellia bacterium]